MKIPALSTCLLLLVSTGALAAGDVAAGKAKSAACVACHGADGNSPDPQWPNLAGQNADYISKQLADYQAGTSRNNAIMAGMAAALSEQDMADLGAYYASQTPAGGTADAGTVDLGETIYRGGNLETGVPACMACHGPAGDGDPLGGFPALAGQHPTYTVAQLQAFHSGARANDVNRMMRGAVRWLTPAEMDAVASYIAGLH